MLKSESKSEKNLLTSYDIWQIFCQDISVNVAFYCKAAIKLFANCCIVYLKK